MMLRWGIRPVIWGVMGMAVIILAVSVCLLLTVFTAPVFWVTFAIWAVVISLFQGAVAFENYTGKANPITRIIRKFSLYN